MTYTEIKQRNKKKYFYRVQSIRQGKKVLKKREYLGVNLTKKELALKEKEADKKMSLSSDNKTNKNIEKIKYKIINLLKKNKVKRAGIFGSYARGDQKKNSDIDILVEIKNPNMSLLGFVGLKLKLEEIIGKKVDLVEYNAIKPLIKNRVLKEEVRIL